MYTSIEIDFDVYKALTARLRSPESAYNDVVRELLGLHPDEKPQAPSAPEHGPSAGWVGKGVTLPQGTELRARRGGQLHYAKIADGAILHEGKRYKSPSGAAYGVVGTSVNGWTFWECKLPGRATWTLLKELR